MIFNTKKLSILLIFSYVFGFAQNKNKHEVLNTELMKLTTQKDVVGVTAGYSLNNKVYWKNSEGLADVEHNIHFSDTTKTRTASVGKLMTAIAIMQLVEKEQIDLDIAIKKYIPKLKNKTAGSVTVRQLLSHTSGIGHYESPKEYDSYDHYPRLEDAMNVFINRPLKFKPGTGYAYTSYGYVVLGVIIEKVTGMCYEDYMKDNIWNVAKMTDTNVELFHQLPLSIARNYKYDKNKKMVKAKRNNLSNRVPGGGFYTTLNDMIKFGNAIINNQLIAECTLDLMLQNQYIPKSTKSDTAQGLGFIIYNTNHKNYTVIGHTGSQIGASNQLYLMLEHKGVVAVLSNSTNKLKEINQYATSIIKHINTSEPFDVQLDTIIAN